MNRTPEWIIERATARIAGRIEFTTEVKENKDIILRHEYGDGEVDEVEFRSYAWAERDNTDDSVYKWVNRHVDDLLTKIAKRRKALSEMNRNLKPDEADLLVKVSKEVETLRPVTRPRGRPPGTNKKVTAPSETAST